MVNLTMSHLLASSSNNRKKATDGDSSTTTTPTVFQSNLACVLNDPKKTRAEISTFFTKTWGNSFIDHLPDPLTRLGDYNLNDFETYFNSLRKSEKYGRPRLVHQSSNDLNILQKSNSTINIPNLFLSSQFSLSDTSTFDQVFPGIIPPSRSLSPTNFEQTKSRTTSTSSDKSDGNYRRQSTSSTNNNIKSTSNGIVNTNSSSPKHSISSATRFLQDKYSHYLDEVELLITRALSTKSHCFHDAVRSHDEIQSFLSTTRNAIQSLRNELSNYDSQSLLTLLRLCRLIRQRQNQRELLKRLQSLTIVKQTHSQVQALLKTSDYLSALDLIDVTRDIVTTQLNDLICLRFYDAQLNELYLFIINLMREEFGLILTNHLLNQQDLLLTNDYLEEDKLGTILIGLIRVKDQKYIEEIRLKFQQFILDIIEKTISSYSKDNYYEKSNKTTVKNNR
jgi:vacuolar protein sorting-associated protein 54